MKSILKFVTLAVFAAFASTSLLAQSNPLLGTWKLNSAKSKSDPTPVPKSLTRTVEETSDGTKYTMKGENADGTPISYGFTVKFDGKDYPLTGDPVSDARSYKTVDDHTLAISNKKGGKVTTSGKIVVAPDGKSRTLHVTGTDAAGKKVSSVAVYDKQ